MRCEATNGVIIARAAAVHLAPDGVGLEDRVDLVAAEVLREILLLPHAIAAATTELEVLAGAVSEGPGLSTVGSVVLPVARRERSSVTADTHARTVGAGGVGRVC